MLSYGLNMQSALVAITFISFSPLSSHATPSDPSATVPQSVVPITTAKAFINGSMHEVHIGDSLAVKAVISDTQNIKNVVKHSSGSISTTRIPSATSASLQPATVSNRKPADWPADDAFSIDWDHSDVKGSSYCSPGYKSFWYNNWDTDPKNRPAACNAVVVDKLNEIRDNSGQTQLAAGSIFWGPEKDGTNVCYWHFNCPRWEECGSHAETYRELEACGSHPKISYQNVQDM